MGSMHAERKICYEGSEKVAEEGKRQSAIGKECTSVRQNKLECNHAHLNALSRGLNQ